MYSIARPSKLNYLFLVNVEFSDSSNFHAVYESDNTYPEFLIFDLKVIKDSINMNHDHSINKITVIDLDNNYVNQK